jgi:hypothetical protein
MPQTVVPRFLLACVLKKCRGSVAHFRIIQFIIFLEQTREFISENDTKSQISQLLDLF